MNPTAGPAKSRYLLISLAVLVADQWTKWLVETRVPLHSSREIVPGLLHLSHVQNSGVAFGLFPAAGSAAATWTLALLGVAALTLVGAYFRRTPPTERLLLASLSLVLGGALGNLLDRVTAGTVTDFIGVYLGSYRWPDFNVADSAISVGLVLMVVESFLPRRAAAAPAP